MQSQLPPPPPRISSRTRALNQRRDAASGVALIELPKQHKAMHSLDELSLFAIIDAMPVMQATKRTRARSTMAARPRMSLADSSIRIPSSSTSRKCLSSVLAAGPSSSSSTKRKPKTKASSLSRNPTDSITYPQILANLSTSDVDMKTRSLEIISGDNLESEPALPIHTAIRIVLEASLQLGRPYDTNMLAMTFGVTRSLVMQSLRKHFETLVEQSLFTEKHFVPTYLWIYGLHEDKEAHAKILEAISLTGAAEPGCRSVFAIARDFVILYINEVILEGRGTLADIKHPPEVPTCFFDMSNSFQYRARMTGRQITKLTPEHKIFS